MNDSCTQSVVFSYRVLLQSPAVASAAQLLNSSAGALLATQSGPMVEAIQNITGLLQPANATGRSASVTERKAFPLRCIPCCACCDAATNTF